LIMIASTLLDLFAVLILASYMQGFLPARRQQVLESKLGIVNSVGTF
jgi:hypothetical protein